MYIASLVNLVASVLGQCPSHIVQSEKFALNNMITSPHDIMCDYIHTSILSLGKELNKLLCFRSNPIVVLLYVLYM